MNTRDGGDPRTVLLVDLGTQSLRVSALDTRGQRLWSWSAPISTRIEGDLSEQAPDEWSELLDGALTRAWNEGIRPSAISAAGPLAGYVALDARGRALTPAVMYPDRRSMPDATRIASMLPADAPRTLISDPLPHWLRFSRETPSLSADTAHFVDATGWLNHRLTGAATLNPHTASRLQAAEFRQRIGAGRAPFGRTTRIGETVGAVREGVFAGVPVIAATFDSKCAYIGSGLQVPGQALDISGTVTSFGVVCPQRIDDPQRRFYCVPFGEQWLVRGSTACAGSALEWVRQQVLDNTVLELEAMARSVPAGARGLSFLPYLAGERAPWWNPQARGALLGLSLTSTRADLARAVLEGLAFSLGHIVLAMRECGVELHDVRVAGGLARSDLLTQIKTDVLGVPVVRLADHELTTLGLAVIASVALGVFPDHASASRCFVAVQDRFEPGPDAAAHQAALARYVADAQAIAQTFGAAR